MPADRKNLRNPAPKWSLSKQFVRALVNAFEWGDYEYEICSFRMMPWPLKFWLTKYDEERRQSWHRKLFPWRIRTALATLLWDMTYRTCTRCDKGFTLRELLKRDGTLMYFQSGSVCHRDCGPSESYKQMIQKFRGRDAC